MKDNDTRSEQYDMPLTDEERDQVLERAFATGSFDLIDEGERKLIREQKNHKWGDLRAALHEMGADDSQLDRLYGDLLAQKRGDLCHSPRSTQMTISQLTEKSDKKRTFHVLILCATLLLAIVTAGGFLSYNYHLATAEQAKIREQQARLESEQRQLNFERQKVIAEINAKLALDKEKLKEERRIVELHNKEKIAAMEAEVTQLELAYNSLNELYHKVKIEERKVRDSLLNYRFALQNVQEQSGGVGGAVATTISEYWRGGTPQERLAWRRYHAYQSDQESYKQIAREYNDAAQRLKESGVFSKLSLPESVPLEITDRS